MPVLPRRAIRPAATITGTTCRVCHSPDTAPWREKRDFPIWRCRACTNAFVPEAAVPPELEALYTPAYFAGGNDTGYPGYLDDAPILERNFARRLRWIERLRPPSRLLDVGTAYGICLKVARARGWEAVGIELVAECARAAERLAAAPVLAGDFLALDVPGAFDVVTMFDVLEHFRDPGACVARAFELLAPGGLLVIETGDVASFWARLLGRTWYFLDPPQHLSYFTAAGLLDLLARRGFAIPRSPGRLGRLVSLANVAFKLSHHAPGAALQATARLARRVLPGAVYLNFGDVLMAVGRRP
jgi:SAM-dependent methyltransferase